MRTGLERRFAAQGDHRGLLSRSRHLVGSTADYLAPSIARAHTYLKQNALEHWGPEIELLIDNHHRLRAYKDTRYPLVELFRKADLVDVSLGLVTCGLSWHYIGRVKALFPNAGFHWRLVRLVGGWAPRHPGNPLPFLRW